MKALTKIAATVAAIPVAGLIALTSAGAAQALTCDPGYVPVTFNGIQSCSPTGTGGTGGEGNVSTGTGGSTTPGQAGGIVNGGSGGGPIPGYVAPAPAPIYVAPQPAPAPAPAPAYKVPTQQTPVKIPEPAQNSIPVAPSVPDPIPAGNAGDASVDPSSGSSVDASVPEVAPIIAPAAPVDVAVTNKVAPDDSIASASPSVSADPTENNSIDASQASDTQSTPSSLALVILGLCVLAGVPTFFLVRHILAGREIRKSF